ncbi:hypothetical protein [Tropicimonas marinistellae]|uniref:hypothetical protein n=1 Tax=Tropicimonas marinistellae TaxID=1739787 RepID=UPI000833515E|nr:hypothetical protein [Tropicimonas marinistellae]
MSSTSELLTNLHALVRSLEEMRNEVSAELMRPDGAASLKSSERAQLSDLHRRISAALKELSAEERQM